MKYLKRFLLCLIVFVLFACGTVKQYTAYTIYPIGYLLNRIAGDKINAVSIQNNNDMVQLAQFSANGKEILEDSFAFFHIGELEPYLGVYEEEIKEASFTDVDLSTLNAVYKFQRYTLAYVDDKETYVEGPFYEGDIFKEIDKDDLDLFLWLNPIGMLSMAKDIYRYLSSNYAEEAAFFKTNYDKLENDLIALDAAYQALSSRLKSARKTIKFVSMTASFSNWQKDYGFQIYPICISKYGALPSENQLAAIKARIVSDGVEYIAYEPNMNEAMLDLFTSIESELNLKRINLSNISSLTVSQMNDNKDYMSLMYDNLNTLDNLATTLIEADNSQEEVQEENSEEEDNDETASN